MSNNQNDNYNEAVRDGHIKRPKTCRRCLRQYIGRHKCEVVETEQERVKQEGRY